MSTSFFDERETSLLVTPEFLRQLDKFVEKSLSPAPTDGSGSPQVQNSRQWAVVYNDRTSDYDLDLDYVLNLPNSPGRTVKRLTLVSNQGYTPEIRIVLGARRRRYAGSGWEVDCTGSVKDVLPFRDEFWQLIGSAVPRYDWFRKFPMNWITIGSLVGVVILFTGHVVFSAPWANVSRFAVFCLIAAALLAPACSPIREALYPDFLCTVGDGARKHRVLDGWRNCLLQVSAAFYSEPWAPQCSACGMQLPRSQLASSR